MRELLLSVVLLSCSAAALPARDTGVQNGKGAPARPVSRFINAGLLLEDVRVLAGDAMEGRGTGTAGAAMARAYIIRRLSDAGVKPFGASYEKPFDAAPGRDGEEREGVNVVGHVRGKKYPERFIVVTAHYDHLGVRDGQIYNGADDNASGVAALLQLAAYFSRRQPENSMLFAALDAEEHGLLGARALVRSLTSEKRHVALNVNMDMVSRSDRGELYAAGTYHNPALRPHLERVAAGAPVRLLLGHDRPEQRRDDWTNQSDHFAFHQAKIPFIYFGVEDHKDYHKPTDDFAAITPDFYVRAVETILDALKVLDDNSASLMPRKS